jgi:hypothetical protein
MTLESMEKDGIGNSERSNYESFFELVAAASV